MTPNKKILQQTALTAAHHDFEKGLTSYALFKVHDRILGQDLVQETFTKTWSYLVKGGKIDVMKSFLYHVLNHLIVDEYRKKKPTSLEVFFEKGYDELSIENSERLFDALDGKAALLLIQRLPANYQKVMHMLYIEDLSLQEIAIKTKQSKNTVTVQIHRGLEKIRVLYNLEGERVK